MAAVFAGLALAVITLLLACLVMLGAQHESPMDGFDPSPPTPLAAFARRILGLHVFKAAEFTAGRPEVTAAPIRTLAATGIKKTGAPD